MRCYRCGRDGAHRGTRRCEDSTACDIAAWRDVADRYEQSRDAHARALGALAYAVDRLLRADSTGTVADFRREARATRTALRRAEKVLVTR